MKIEKNIPLPDKCAKRSNTKYPFKDMDAGDSFPFPASSSKEVNRIRMAACQWSKRHGATAVFLVRRTPEGGRCWRVK